MEHAFGCDQILELTGGTYIDRIHSVWFLRYRRCSQLCIGEISPVLPTTALALQIKATPISWQLINKSVKRSALDIEEGLYERR